jgi:hypothetical protein
MNTTADLTFICRGCGIDLSDLTHPFYFVTTTETLCNNEGAVMTTIRSEPMAFCEKCHHEGRSAP